MKVYLLDDEQKAITNLRFLLSEYFPDVVVCGSSTNPVEARKEILIKNPDILFLDISMPYENGLEFAKTMEQLQTLHVFVTAHPNHAIDAFKVSAFDYLLKPVQVKDLLQVLQRAQKQFETRKPLLHQNESIKIRYEGKTLLIGPQEVIYISSEGNYSTIYFVSRKPIKLSKNMKQIEDLYFNAYPFFRIHQSYTINISKIIQYSQAEVTLNENTTLPISRQKRDDFLTITRTL